MINHGNFLIPEGLETGEVKISGTASFSELTPFYIIAFVGDNYLGNNIGKYRGKSYNGIYSGIMYLLTNNIAIAIDNINNAGDGDKIVTIFTVPKCAIESELPSDWELGFVKPLTATFKANPITNNFIQRPNSIDGYTPRNKKLLTYPYLYLGFNPQNR